MKEWPEEGLDFIANKFLCDTEIEKTIKPDLIQMCKMFHISSSSFASK
jgi:hypothetical protein